MEFEESRIGKTYCEDLQKFFGSLIGGVDVWHIQRLKVQSVSKHGTDVFMQYMLSLMNKGMSSCRMLSDIYIDFEYIGNYQMFEAKVTALIDAALVAIRRMIESQFGIEQCLREDMKMNVCFVDLILEYCRFHRISIRINEQQNDFDQFDANEVSTGMRPRFAKVTMQRKMKQKCQLPISDGNA